jgi:hypothetical protein
MRIERVLLLVHERSATGHDLREVRALARALRAHLPRSIGIEARTAKDHHDVKASSRDFADAYDGPVAIIAGGGGGTLRAVLEAVIDANASERIRIAPLRFGSGNVLARRLRIPSDPFTAIERIARALENDVHVFSSIMRLDAGTRDDATITHYAATLAAFGQAGRLAHDVSRIRALGPRAFRALANGFGIERVNHAHYASCFASRTVRTLLDPDAMEEVEIRTSTSVQRTRLFSALAMKTRVPEVPFDPGVDIEENAIAVAVAPWRGRGEAMRALLSKDALVDGLERHRIGPSDRFELRLLDRPSARFFVDEDPLEFFHHATISLAGRAALVPAIA